MRRPVLAGAVCHVFYSLRRVAAARGQHSFTDAEYAETREKLVAEDRRRWRYGGVLDETLLTSSQIIYYAGNDWNAALELAGRSHTCRQSWPECRSAMP